MYVAAPAPTVAHSPKFAKKAGVPQKVGKDFADADEKSGKYKGKAAMSKLRSRGC